MAPEVLSEDYTYKCDIWSIGVIAYILLCGFAPFAGDDDMETIHLVQTAALEFPSPEWDDISDEAKDFVQSLLQREAYARPTAAEAMKHPWIAKHISATPGIPPPKPFSNSWRSGGEPDDRIAKHKKAVSESTYVSGGSTRRTAFRKFLAGLKIQKAMKGAAQQLTPTEAKQLGSVFDKVDKDRDGRITVVDLDVAVNQSSFSNSVKQNLKEMRSHLVTYPQVSFDIRPFMGLVSKRAKSDSTIHEDLRNSQT